MEPQHLHTREQTRELLTDTISALERLLKVFRIERVLHLILTVVGFGLLVYSIVLLMRSKDLTSELRLSLFGSSGLIAVSSARVTFFFGKAFRLIEDIIHSLLKQGGDHE